MDTSRTPPGSNKRRRSPPSGQLSMGSQGQQGQTSLPSIHQLGAYLPPTSSISQHVSTEPSAYAYPPSHFHSNVSQLDSGTSHAMGSAAARDLMYSVDSDPDDLEQRGPPKKKRRRQALSCTGDYIQLFVIRVVPLMLTVDSIRGSLIDFV
ncbi:hypothetical protein JR316_0008546 [Psilocybe cubensis]|uniref:Uncharacterized protein n=2 Tax=Psilocybe cubensis TaxID=181762 RepID=A0A8H7XLK8_PSICU|nr:hypothetical protein JR316_0008546 [Psilocybe cubensis]KAH9479949.1 hypothetical protein JR316_0008546 [Psilocybe cubensis]